MMSCMHFSVGEGSGSRDGRNTHPPDSKATQEMQCDSNGNSVSDSAKEVHEAPFHDALRSDIPVEQQVRALKTSPVARCMCALVLECQREGKRW